MSVITLITDWGNKDCAIVEAKVSIFKKNPSVTVFDISHEITPYNILEAAYFLESVYAKFPEKTIHLIGVNCTPTEDNPLLIVFWNQHYFIGVDSGIFSLFIKNNKPNKVIKVLVERTKNHVFNEVVIPIATQIIEDESLESFGKLVRIKELNSAPLKFENNLITASVVYIDHFGNAVTNLTQSFFETHTKNGDFKIEIGYQYVFDCIYKSYQEFIEMVPESLDRAGKELLKFNSAGQLEICLYQSDPQKTGGAASLLGLKIGSLIKIKMS